MAAIAGVEATEAENPAATTLAVLAAFGFLFTISGFAVASLGARNQAEALLAQETAAGKAGSARRRWPSARAWPATCTTCWPIACRSWPCSSRRRG